MAEPVVFDTSACFAFLENEEGADVVEAYLMQAREGNVDLRASFVTLTELEYIITQERGEAEALAALTKIKAWPVRWEQSDETLCGEAAKLKAKYKLSFADVFVAATAKRFDAVILHKDPEFEALNGVIKLQPLPFKSPEAKGKS